MHDAIPSIVKLNTGVLVVHVSTTGADDERCWASAERQFHGSSTFVVRARFGPGSAVVSAPWTTTEGQDDTGSDQLRRDATVSCSRAYHFFFFLKIREIVFLSCQHPDVGPFHRVALIICVLDSRALLLDK